jgi:ribosomal protein S26
MTVHTKEYMNNFYCVHCALFFVHFPARFREHNIEKVPNVKRSYMMKNTLRKEEYFNILTTVLCSNIDLNLL